MNGKRYFAAIVGSGFAGSLLAWILQRSGKEVVLIDRATHPRFAIGESSTPVADFLLEHIADRWSLPEIRPLARWGSWKESYPHLRCGKKRGFSYYNHISGQAHCDDQANSQSMLVAASNNDSVSDTHWLRADVDQFFHDSAVAEGVQSMAPVDLQHAEWNQVHRRWKISFQWKEGMARDGCSNIDADWLIDSSGSGSGLAQWLGTRDDSDWMQVRTGAVFGHFSHVEPFASTTESYSNDLAHYFDGDDAAQHHIVEDGWIWMLRFDHGVTSVGRVFHATRFTKNTVDGPTIWQDALDRYPSIKTMLGNAQLVAPSQGLTTMARMSRCRDRCMGDGWIALPTTFGFVDPLHSSGIAHGLSGVTRVAESLLARHAESRRLLAEYSDSLRSEVEWIDRVVSGCYLGLPHFELFTAMASFYFLSAVQTERQLRCDPQSSPKGFLAWKEAGLREAEHRIRSAMQGTIDRCDVPNMVDAIRSAIEPWNDVGLLHPPNPHRIAHTIAKSAST